jgi:hypothetical protein
VLGAASLIPLRPLHAATSLSQAKLAVLSRLSTDELILSLRPEQPGALKVRPDGTILDGHHRIRILLDRRVNVNSLPREIIERADPSAGDAP